MSPSKILLCLILVLLLSFVFDVEGRRPRRRRRRRHRRIPRRTENNRINRRREFVRRRLSRRRNRNRPYEGKIRLVDGKGDYEGNVEIFHEGEWGNICDDEWDLREAEIVCKTLGYPDALKITYNGHFGNIRHKYWMDNLYCYGHEKRLNKCRHDGWGKHDCESDEAAGVICETLLETTTTAKPPQVEQQLKDQPVDLKKSLISEVFEEELILQLEGGRIKEEGRVEIEFVNRNGTKGLICGDDWSLLEAMVVCRELGLGYAQSAPSTGYFGGNSSDIMLSGVKCTGNENKLSQCLHDVTEDISCPGPNAFESNIAGVTCVDKMADLVPDITELARSTHLEDKQLYFLQCAIEENCLASAAYKYMDSGYGWHLDTRRLLRFTARIINQGDDVFLPFLPKNHWQWHACHMHYHSMEVFARYDIVDKNGVKVAEGHKASFCLEDNNCLPGVTPHFKCANFGDQGISPGCTDTYAYNIDCQWIDITELLPGNYTFKIEINPEFKVAEKTFDNNAAVCTLMYSEVHAWLGNCTHARPTHR